MLELIPEVKTAYTSIFTLNGNVRYPMSNQMTSCQTTLPLCREQPAETTCLRGVSGLKSILPTSISRFIIPSLEKDTVH